MLARIGARVARKGVPDTSRQGEKRRSKDRPGNAAVVQPVIEPGPAVAALSPEDPEKDLDFRWFRRWPTDRGTIHNGAGSTAVDATEEPGPR